MALIKQSATYTRTFYMVDSTDHVSGKTGLTVTVNISKAGAAGGAAAGAVSQVDAANLPGWYKIALTSGDTGTLGDLSYHCTASGADPTDFVDQIVAVDPLDGASFGLSFSELSQAQPPISPTLAQALMLLYMALRNQGISTATSLKIHNDAGTVITKSTLSDDGTTFTRAKLVTGP